MAPDFNSIIRRNYRRRPVASAAVLCGALLLIGYVLFGDQGGSAASDRGALDEVEVELQPVVFQPIDRTILVVGTIHGDEESTISAKVSGRVARYLVDVGDRVAPGDLLVQLETTDYELVVNEKRMALAEATARLGLTAPPPSDFDVRSVAHVRRAEAQADNAKVKLERAQRLRDEKPPLISEQDFADLDTAYQVAKRDYEVALLDARSQVALARTRASELAAAEQRLRDASMRAPLLPESDGNKARQYGVARRHISLGEFIREGDPVVDLVLDDVVKFKTAVPERFVGDVRIGQQAELQVESYEQTFHGTVTRISPAISPESRTFAVEVEVPNDERLLRPGAFARGKLIVGKLPRVPFVPPEAVISFAGVERVYSIADGKAVEHLVQLGEKRDGRIAVIKGLDEVQQIVVSGAGRLSDGQPVIAKSGVN